MEIERKFTVKEIPADLDEYPCLTIEQAYLNTDPVIRIRRQNDDYYLTYKGKGLLAREEYNLPLNKEAYEHLRTKADGNIISKKRYVIPAEGSLNIELDIFEEPFKSLVIAEVEFPDLESANAYVMPQWFAKDVTNDPAYHNSNLSKQ